jgi:hypothetical protein
VIYCLGKGIFFFGCFEIGEEKIDSFFEGDPKLYIANADIYRLHFGQQPYSFYFSTSSINGTLRRTGELKPNSEQKVENIFVAPHIAKLHVSGWLLRRGGCFSSTRH